MPKTLSQRVTRDLSRVGHAERMREKIRSGKYLDMLDKHIRGQKEMTASQVNAALKLINKVLPDMKAIEFKLDAADMDIKTVTNAQLFSIIEGKAERVEQGK